MIYKTLKKVSNVCQLLDKSKYPIVITNAGVTTTSNGDGSITINGTATASTYINCTPLYPKENNGHVFYVCANNTTMGMSTWQYGLLNQYRILDTGGGVIGKTNALVEKSTGITFNKGVVFDNVIIKPQIIDLTEMYGAGNEPTTVEQFRQDFPDEMYDYKPYCFVKSYKTLLKATDNNIITSYKKSLICTTKNLFDSEDWYNTLHAISSTSMVKETVNGIEYYKFMPNDIFNYEYMKGKFKENTIYTLSCLGMNADGTNNRYSGFQIYHTDGTRSLFYINTGEEQKYTVTTLSNKTVDYIILGYNVNGYVLVRNIQLEEGSTATEYHPYGYL